MKLTKLFLALAFASVSGTAMAVPVSWTGTFTMYTPMGNMLDANDGKPGFAATVSGYIDEAAGTFTLASEDTLLGVTWSTSVGKLYTPGTYTVDVNGDGANAIYGSNLVTFTVGEGQLGGNIDFSWAITTGIDVFNVWDVTTNGVYTSTDFDLDGIPGGKFADGPFFGPLDGQTVGFSPNFNMTLVPEASTYGMMLAGLGLVSGMAARRRKPIA